LRRLGSRLEGHPSPSLPWVDVATGSLGFGLPVGVGIALAAKTVDPRPYRVWVLVGDSEMVSLGAEFPTPFRASILRPGLPTPLPRAGRAET
jgi:thiamine pyrophosphate-dependent acetolactate synthase large subunit-like protein